MNRKRILCIDGGGIKGVFPVSLLAHIESALSLKSVANYFDLIAGTSVGGIIALGLGLGLTAQRMTDFMIKQGPLIFPSSPFPTSTLRLLFGMERYKPKNLRRAVEEIFGTMTLRDSRVRLLIPSFNATNGDIHIYKTAHHERLGMDYNLSAVEVAMATAAAPTLAPLLGLARGWARILSWKRTMVHADPSKKWKGKPAARQSSYPSGPPTLEKTAFPPIILIS